MKILIVEDEPFKLDDIRGVVENIAGSTITTATSLRTAMTELEDGDFDFVVLDMAIPSHTSDAGAVDTYSQPVGGLDVLLFLSSARRAERVAILTQHPTVEYDRRHVRLKELSGILASDGVSNVAGVIQHTEGEGWKRLLLAAMGASR